MQIVSQNLTINPKLQVTRFGKISDPIYTHVSQEAI